MNEPSFAVRTDTDKKHWLQSIIRAAPTGIGVVKERVFLYVNEKICEMTGYSVDELIGQNSRMLYPTQEDFEYVGREKYVQIKDHGTGMVETRWRRKDGHNIDVMLSSTPMDPDDLSKGVTFTALDISERKAAERKVLDYQAQLRELVAQLTLTEEQERRRIATELHDDVGQILALTKMKVDGALASEQDPERTAFLTDVQQSLETVLTKTQWLTRDMGSPTLCQFGLEVAVREWLAQEIEKKHDIAVNVISNRKSRTLDDTSKVLVFRAIRELAVNVVKHARARHLNVSIQQQNDRLWICVSDDGIGFDPKKIESASAHTVGGYGLFSIKERISHMGGTVDIQSQPGQGTRVTLELPCDAPEQ